MTDDWRLFRTHLFNWSYPSYSYIGNSICCLPLFHLKWRTVTHCSFRQTYGYICVRWGCRFHLRRPSQSLAVRHGCENLRKHADGGCLVFPALTVGPRIDILPIIFTILRLVTRRCRYSMRWSPKSSLLSSWLTKIDGLSVPWKRGQRNSGSFFRVSTVTERLSAFV